MRREGITGVVLAGGKSSRMGTDKGLLTYKGKKLVQHAIDCISPYCDELLISSNSPEYSKFGYSVVSDKYKSIGPIGGWHAGIFSAKYNRILLIACDTPDVQTELIQILNIPES